MLENHQDFKFEIDLYHSMLDTLAELKAQPEIAQVMTDMQERDILITSRTFRPLIKMSLKRGETKRVLQLISYMGKRKMQLDEETRKAIDEFGIIKETVELWEKHCKDEKK